MSDADEFDKEAERERLREKYEAEQKEREATQRMSELLLQGATMTNRHCENCGDPIFRYDGQEFCPSCGAGTGQGPAGTDGTGDAAEATPDATGAGASTPDRGETPPATHPGEGPGRDREASRDAGTGDRYAGPGDRDDRSGDGPGAPTDGAAGETPAPSERPPPPGADAEDPRVALAATAARMARRADATDDPRKAREWLAAAREAAAALAAIDGRRPDAG